MITSVKNLKDWILKSHQNFFDKALKLDSEGINIWKNKAYSLAMLKQYDIAEKCINRALEIDGDDAESWYNKSWIQVLKNNVENSLNSLRKAIKIDIKYVNSAKNDKNFDNIKELKEFRDLVNIK